MQRILFCALLIGACAVLSLSTVQTAAPQNPPAAAGAAAPRAVFEKYCFTCHNQKLRTAGVTLDNLDVANPSSNAEVWERVIVKLRGGTMPPPGNPRPDAETYRTTAVWLENEIDRVWAAKPNPGRIGAVHRLNRTEYNNVIRDLFALNMDVRSQLPGDETAD